METKHGLIVIRFAGDRVTACNSPVRGSKPQRGRQRHRDVPGFPRRDPRARRPLAGVSGFQLHFSSTEIHTPGDAPDVLVVMNPAALKTNLKDLPTAARHRQQRHVHRGEPQEGRLRGQPARGRHAREVQAALRRHLAPDAHRARRRRHLDQGEGPREELLRARPGVLDVRPRHRDGDPAHLPAVREEARVRRGERQGLQGRLSLRRDRRGLPDAVQGAARASRRACTATSRATRRSRSDSSPARTSPTSRSSTAAIRSRRRRRSCTSARQVQELGDVTFQAEDEIAAAGAAIGASYGGAIAVTASSGPASRSRARRSASRS